MLNRIEKKKDDGDLAENEFNVMYDDDSVGSIAIHNMSEGNKVPIVDYTYYRFRRSRSKVYVCKKFL